MYIVLIGEAVSQNEHIAQLLELFRVCITVITKAQLANEYGILDKDYGVVILADLPVN